MLLSQQEDIQPSNPKPSHTFFLVYWLIFVRKCLVIFIVQPIGKYLYIKLLFLSLRACKRNIVVPIIYRKNSTLILLLHKHLKLLLTCYKIILLKRIFVSLILQFFLLKISHFVKLDDWPVPGRLKYKMLHFCIHLWILCGKEKLVLHKKLLKH